MMSKTTQHKQQRSDQSLAVYGILTITFVGLVGYILLLALDKEPPSDILGVVVAAGISGVLGWARGGTYYDPTPEKVPAAPVETFGVPVTPVVIPPSQIVEEFNLTGPDNHTEENSVGNG